MTKPKYRQNTKTFMYTNPHPKDSKTIGDCVIRAISIATKKDWLTVYDELTAIGREVLAPPTDIKVIREYMDGIAERVPAMKNRKRLLPTDLPKSGTFVVRQSHHLTCVRNGKIRDTWNSGNKSAYIIWRVA